MTFIEFITKYFCNTTTCFSNTNCSKDFYCECEDCLLYYGGCETKEEDKKTL